LWQYLSPAATRCAFGAVAGLRCPRLPPQRRAHPLRDPAGNTTTSPVSTPPASWTGPASRLPQGDHQPAVNAGSRSSPRAPRTPIPHSDPVWLCPSTGSKPRARRSLHPPQVPARPAGLLTPARPWARDHRHTVGHHSWRPDHLHIRAFPESAALAPPGRSARTLSASNVHPEGRLRDVGLPAPCPPYTRSRYLPPPPCFCHSHAPLPQRTVSVAGCADQR